MNDKQRLDKLDALMERTAYVNKKVTKMSLSTDIHIRDSVVTIYLRNMYGGIEEMGTGKTIREAIDELT